MTYHVYSNYTLNGLSIDHMKEIETLIGVYEPDEYDIKPPSNKLSLSIIEINRSVYYAIKKQIGGADKQFVPIESLPVIQFIKTNWKYNKYQKHFLYFAQMFKLIRKYKPNGLYWTNANILPRLRHMILDSEINRRYAACLGKLYHCDEADVLFNKVIKNSRIWLHRMEYGYFLLKSERYSEAYYQFHFIVRNQMHDVARKSRVYLGYAEVLEHLQKLREAEKYYKLAVDPDIDALWGQDQFSDSVLASKYAKFLFNQQRYKESVEQFKIAIHNDSTPFADDHLGIGKAYYKMGMHDKFEYHLKFALDIDDSIYEAKCLLDKHNMRQQMVVMEINNDIGVCQHNYDNDMINCDIDDGKKNMTISEVITPNVGNSSYNIEFDGFWFDQIDIINDEFNNYYDNFVNENINDIRYLLFRDNIELELRTKIGVNSLEHIQLIMRNIYEIRGEHDEFIKSLNEHNINEYYPLFAFNGIYTMESGKVRIKCKEDVKKSIECYNQNNKNVIKQFNENDNNLIGILFNVFNC
eukprot:459284_1